MPVGQAERRHRKGPADQQVREQQVLDEGHVSGVEAVDDPLGVLPPWLTPVVPARPDVDGGGPQLTRLQLEAGAHRVECASGDGAEVQDELFASALEQEGIGALHTQAGERGVVGGGGPAKRPVFEGVVPVEVALPRRVAVYRNPAIELPEQHAGAVIAVVVTPRQLGFGR
ncbi:MAG: hypothetical protein R2770_07340 [Acidimicrobiales bacterium]